MAGMISDCSQKSQRSACARAADGVGEIVGALGEVHEDRVGLGQRIGALLFEHRGLAHGIQLAEVVGEGVAGEDVHRHALVLVAELGQQEADLVAVAGGGIVMQSQGHGCFNA